MPTFVATGYGDQAGYDRTDPAIRSRAHAQDDRLLEAGARIGVAGSPVQVRNPEMGGVQRRSGAYMSSGLPVAGFTVIEAEDIDEAVSLVAETPCAVAHGVVEVSPLKN